MTHRLASTAGGARELPRGLGRRHWQIASAYARDGLWEHSALGKTAAHHVTESALR